LQLAFDVVVALDVVEHLDQPRGALEICRSHLKPGGWLFLSTPDSGSLASRVMGRRWPYQDPEQHVNLFSRSNLSRLLEECGFRVEAHTHFSREYKMRYIVNRLEYLLQDHPARRLIAVMRYLPDRVLRSRMTLKLWDVMGLAARAGTELAPR
jgi:predicted SAM-dependent methyltransferase